MNTRRIKMELKFRPLKASEIEVRIGSTTKKTFSLLLYKDARVDMALLDEVVGKGRWQREHKILGNDIYCRVGIYNEELKSWVWVEDAGSSGSIEVEKSKASDSFKRACVNLGIGRELYTSPEIKIWKTNENDDSYKYNHYFVKDIDYKDNEISKLIICEEQSGEVVFTYPKYQKSSQTAQKPTQNTFQGGKVEDITKGLGDTFDLNNDNDLMCSQETKAKIQDIIGKYDGDKMARFKNYIKTTFGTELISELTENQGQQLLKALGGK